MGCVRLANCLPGSRLQRSLARPHSSGSNPGSPVAHHTSTQNKKLSKGCQTNCRYDNFMVGCHTKSCLGCKQGQPKSCCQKDAVTDTTLTNLKLSIGDSWMTIKAWLNRYSWGAGKLGSEYSLWFRRLECIRWRFLTMSRLSKCLYNVRSCRNSSEYSKTAGNFLPLRIRI